MNFNGDLVYRNSPGLDWPVKFVAIGQYSLRVFHVKTSKVNIFTSVSLSSTQLEKVHVNFFTQGRENYSFSLECA